MFRAWVVDSRCNVCQFDWISKLLCELLERSLLIEKFLTCVSGSYLSVMDDCFPSCFVGLRLTFCAVLKNLRMFGYLAWLLMIRFYYGRGHVMVWWISVVILINSGRWQWWWLCLPLNWCVLGLEITHFWLILNDWFYASCVCVCSFPGKPGWRCWTAPRSSRKSPSKNMLCCDLEAKISELECSGVHLAEVSVSSFDTLVSRSQSWSQDSDAK